jgi:hypothetical protein
MNIKSKIIAWISPWYNEDEAALREKRTQQATSHARQTVLEARILLDNYRRSDGLIANRSGI